MCLTTSVVELKKDPLAKIKLCQMLFLKAYFADYQYIEQLVMVLINTSYNLISKRYSQFYIFIPNWLWNLFNFP